MVDAPPMVLSSTIQNAPRKTMKMVLISRVGQKMMAIGIQATGGTGRRISVIGNTVLKAKRLAAISSPSGMPMSCASRKPMDMRMRLL